ncbi:MAG: hypothetical protein IPP37_07920 [Saprospiraceae bacterium]|nr:hypothetical protein [Saprospiraceae bacterium]
MGTPDPNYCATLNLFIGNACNDNNPNTLNDVVNASCECAGTPDPNYCTTLNLFIGNACNDNNPNTLLEMPVMIIILLPSTM